MVWGNTPCHTFLLSCVRQILLWYIVPYESKIKVTTYLPINDKKATGLFDGRVPSIGKSSILPFFDVLD